MIEVYVFSQGAGGFPEYIPLGKFLAALNIRRQGLRAGLAGRDRTTGGGVSKRKQHEALLRFARKVMASWPEGDIEGGDLQEIAVATGLLTKTIATEPCAAGCNCVEYGGNFPMTCYRLPPALLLAGGQQDHDQ